MKKLTGREAVIALMDGKRVQSSSVVPILGTVTILPELNGSRFIAKASLRSTDIYSWELSQIIVHDDWEIVKEPMAWEGGRTGFKLQGAIVIGVPSQFEGKRVKVRIEEIL